MSSNVKKIYWIIFALLFYYCRWSGKGKLGRCGILQQIDKLHAKERYAACPSQKPSLLLESMDLIIITDLMFLWFIRCYTLCKSLSLRPPRSTWEAVQWFVKPKSCVSLKFVSFASSLNAFAVWMSVLFVLWTFMLKLY